MIFSGDRGCKSWPGVSLRPVPVTARETPWRWLMPVQPVEGKEKQQNQWYFMITSLISPPLFQGHGSSSRKSRGGAGASAEPCAPATSAGSPWPSSPLHPGLGGNCSPRGHDSLTPLRKDSRAAPPLAAEETGRGKKKKKLHGDYFACESTRLYFLSEKTRYFLSNC